MSPIFNLQYEDVSMGHKEAMRTTRQGSLILGRKVGATKEAMHIIREGV